MLFLDANIIIYAIKPENNYLFQAMADQNEEIGCSEIVKLEVLGFPALLIPELQKLTEFFNNVAIIPVDRSIIDQAIELRQQRSIGSPDAIIAATALLAKQRLWTINTKDFKWIKGLEWQNPLDNYKSSA